MNWTASKERMPEHDPSVRKWYLVSNGKRCDVAMLLRGKTFFGHVIQFDEAKYWMELPPSPIDAEGTE